jgi:protein-L-isoaspartate(D-aspartate) O-methyltransferase
MRFETYKSSWAAVILLIVVFLLTGCRAEPADTILRTSTPEAVTAPSENSTPPWPPERYAEQRLAMVRETIEARGVEDPGVIRAMRAVPRHLFVPPEFEDQAYNDHPLPIGYGQTISQPYIVAWMTELLELEPGEKVLEIGTGSGYQAAVLVEVGELEIYSIEIVPELAELAEKQLSEAGYTGLNLLQGDGYYGWPEENLQFDAIIVTAAPDHVPAPLAAQLKEGGRMVIPIGPVGGFQTLWKFVKENGELTAHNLGIVRFVPLTGGRQE